MLDLLQIRSVCDVGCGIGTWLKCWQEYGVDDFLGLDGQYVDSKQLMIPVEKFQSTDLSRPFNCGRSFDLVTSLEVAEHLPESRAASFVADLTALAPLVLFSAAVPGQGGVGHINEQWQSYWITLFQRVGFKIFDVIRPSTWTDDRVEYWYRQNTLLFCRPDVIARYPSLATSPGYLPVPLVHPMLLKEAREQPSTRQSIGVLRGALQRAMVRRLHRIWPGAQAG